MMTRIICPIKNWCRKICNGDKSCSRYKSAIVNLRRNRKERKAAIGGKEKK